MYVWGRDLSCDDANNDVTWPSPRPLDACRRVNVSSVSCAAARAVAIGSDGRLYGWGDVCRVTDDEEESRDSSRGRFVGAACTNTGVLVVHETAGPRQRCYMFGEPSNDGKETSWTPHLLSLRDGRASRLGCRRVQLDRNVVRLSCGASHCVALTREGEIYTWGRGEGVGLRREDTSSPRRVSTRRRCVDVSSGEFHNVAVLEDGRAYSWGRNDRGQLGVGDRTSRFTPTLVDTVFDVATVACGASHSVAACRDGSLYTFGSGRFGQLGRGDEACVEDATRPWSITFLAKSPRKAKIMHVAAGDTFTAVSVFF